MNQQAAITGITLGVAYAIMGVGFTLIYRSTRVLNLAHGGVVMLVALLLTRHQIDNVVLRSLAAVGIGVVLMAVVHLLFMRPFMDTPPVVRLVALLGALFMAGGFAQVEFGTTAYSVAPLARGHFDLPLVGGRASWHTAVSFLLAMIVVAGLKLFFSRTVPGMSLRAIADDVVGARLVGIRTALALLGASCLAGGLAGLAAVIVAPQTGVNFEMGFEWTLIAVTTAIVGGVTSEWGALVGGFVVGVAQGFMLSLQPEYFLTVAFAILIVTLALRPEGLFGRDPVIGGR